MAGSLWSCSALIFLEIHSSLNILNAVCLTSLIVLILSLGSCLLCFLTSKYEHSLMHSPWPSFLSVFSSLTIPPRSISYLDMRIYSYLNLLFQHFNLVTDQYFFYFLDISAWLSGTSNHRPKQTHFQTNKTVHPLFPFMLSVSHHPWLLFCLFCVTLPLKLPFILCTPVLFMTAPPSLSGTSVQCWYVESVDTG